MSQTLVENLRQIIQQSGYREFVAALAKREASVNPEYGDAAESDQQPVSNHQILATLLRHNAVMAHTHPSVDYFRATEVLGRLMLLTPQQDYAKSAHYPNDYGPPSAKQWHTSVVRNLLLSSGFTGHDTMMVMTHTYTWQVYVAGGDQKLDFQSQRAQLRAADMEILAMVDTQLTNKNKTPQVLAAEMLLDAMTNTGVLEGPRAGLMDYVKMESHYDAQKNEVFARFLAAATKVLNTSPAHPHTLFRGLIGKDLNDTGGQRTQKLRQVLLGSQAVSAEPELRDRLQRGFDARKERSISHTEYIVLVNLNKDQKYDTVYLSSLDFPREAGGNELVVRLRPGTRAGGPHPRACNVVCDFTNFDVLNKLWTLLKDYLESGERLKVHCDRTSAFGTAGNLARFVSTFAKQKIAFGADIWDLNAASDSSTLDQPGTDLTWVGQLAEQHKTLALPRKFAIHPFSISDRVEQIDRALTQIVRDAPSWAIVFEAAHQEMTRSNLDAKVYLSFRINLQGHARKIFDAQMRPLQAAVLDLERVFKRCPSELAAEAMERTTLWHEVYAEFWKLFETVESVDDAQSAAYMAWSLVADAQALMQIEREGLVSGDLWCSGIDLMGHGAEPFIQQPQAVPPATALTAPSKTAPTPAPAPAQAAAVRVAVGQITAGKISPSNANQSATPAKPAQTQPAAVAPVPTPQARNLAYAQMVTMASAAIDVPGARILTLMVKQDNGKLVAPDNLMRNFRSYFVNNDITKIESNKSRNFVQNQNNVRCYVSKDLGKAHAATIDLYQKARSIYVHGQYPDHQKTIGKTTSALRRTAPHMLMVADVQILHDFSNGNLLQQPYQATMFYNVFPEINNTRSARAYRVDLGLKPLEIRPKQEGGRSKIVYDFDFDLFVKYYKNIISFYMRVAALDKKYLFIPTPQIYFQALNRAGSPSIRFVEAVYQAANDPANLACRGVFIAGEHATGNLLSTGVPVVQVGAINALTLVQISRGDVALCVMGNMWTAGSAALEPHVKAMEEGLTRLTGPQIPLLFSARHNTKLLNPNAWVVV